MKLSDMISYQDYQTVKAIAPKNPELLIAIGWHETKMGALGAGQQGYYLGYGVPTKGNPISKYQGLENQIKYGTKKVEKFVNLESPSLEQLTNLGLGIGVPSDMGWNPGYYDTAGNYIQTGDKWASSIWSIYSGIENDFERGPSPAYTADFKRIEYSPAPGTRNTMQKIKEQAGNIGSSIVSVPNTIKNKANEAKENILGLWPTDWLDEKINAAQFIALRFTLIAITSIVLIFILAKMLNVSPDEVIKNEE